jgi:alanine dehydrogenase
MVDKTLPTFIDAAAVSRALPWDALIAALDQAFRSSFQAPERHIHAITTPGQPEATALLMPAWIEGEAYGVKLVNVFPGNAQSGLPAVNGIYVLFSGTTGVPLAVMDGSVLTARRTAATSALAARYLSRADSHCLTIFGTGRLAPMLAEAHCSIRPIDQILIVGRDMAKSEALASALSTKLGVAASAATDAVTACAAADIISCATLSTEPLVRGAWLKPGTHVDLVGAFKPSMRECDAEAVRRAEVFIDTIGGSKAEAGDLLQAEREGAFVWSDVSADLANLTRGIHPGRTDATAITLFKSVGCAIEDLAAARLVKASVDGGR